jgi:hypothetical protein
VHLNLLSEFIICHRFVLNSFGLGTTVPLFQNKDEHLNDADNYHAITLSSMISNCLRMFHGTFVQFCIINESTAVWL